jgi:predicted Zn-dependent protease
MRRFQPFPAVALATLALTGCPVNPATGERQLMLMSEQQEVQLGLQGAEQVAALYGLYDDPDLQAYVDEIGQELAATSEKPDLPWNFRVIDDPIVNAFALPGGQIFMTRGILGHFASEAEMAAVLGHEIGHVTARHSAEQMSRAQVAGAGLELGAVLSSDIARVRDVLGTGLGLMFLKFGRDDERQSDDLGFRYMGRAGYNRRESVDVFTMLGRVTEAAGGSQLPSLLSTHPDPGERVERMNAALAEAGDTGEGEVGRDRYFRRINGMIFGENPRHGYFKGSLFLHPDLEFSIEFPDGWPTQNMTQAVAAVSPESDALIQLTLAEESSPRAAIDAFLGAEAVTADGRISTRSLNGMPARAVYFSATTEQAELGGLAIFVEYNDLVYQILGYTLAERLDTYDEAFQHSLGSFRRLTDPDALNVQPARIEIVTINRSMTLQQFASRYPSTISLTSLAIINGVAEDATLARGLLVKRVVGGVMPED